MKVCCDTTFLIDLTRNRRKAKTAYSELQARGVKLYTTFLNIGELLAGIQVPVGRVDEATRGIWNIIRGFSVLGVERASVRAVGEIYAALHRRLRQVGSDIPAADKVILAIALAHEITAFITRDVEHFRRVSGIDVIDY